MLEQLAQDPDMGKAACGTPAKRQTNDRACDGGLRMRGGFRRTVAIALSLSPVAKSRRLPRERASPADCWRSLVTET